MNGALEVHVITKKEQEAIQAILDSQALSVVNGDVTLHIQNGVIMSVEIRTVAYKRKALATGTEV